MPKIPFWVFIIIAIVYFTAIRVDIMDIDAAQYASMSRELMKSHNWLQLYDRGLEYLDKPPFLFWVSAASMKLFGVNNFAYRLPSILFALWALYATYGLGKVLYNEQTGRLAAFILGTCQGMFLITNDVRCDTILMSWVVTAVWMVALWEQTGIRKYLFIGFAAVAFGMMTKGPIAFMVPVFCFGSNWVLQRKWKLFLRWEYLVGVVIIAVLLLPMSIGLYQQFDLHPEKTVNGLKGVSGLRFFYWSQSFGRITGESPWKNGADISFLLVNMLWSFLPWIFLLIPAIIVNIITLVKSRFQLAPGNEWVTTGGFLLAYLALGSSAYQLPHYIFVAFPLAAVVTAAFIGRYLDGGQYPLLFRWLRPFIWFILILVIGLVLYLVTLVFPSGIMAAAGWCMGLLLLVFLITRFKDRGRFVVMAGATLIFANIFLTNYVYYSLLHYQGGAVAGKYLYAHGIAKPDCMVYKMHDPMNSFGFYAQENYLFTDTVANLARKGYVVTMDEGLADVQKTGMPYKVMLEGKLFKVSELTPEFLNPKTRKDAVKNYYILHLMP